MPLGWSEQQYLVIQLSVLKDLWCKSRGSFFSEQKGTHTVVSDEGPRRGAGLGATPHSGS